MNAQCSPTLKWLKHHFHIVPNHQLINKPKLRALPKGEPVVLIIIITCYYFHHYHVRSLPDGRTTAEPEAAAAEQVSENIKRYDKIAIIEKYDKMATYVSSHVF